MSQTTTPPWQQTTGFEQEPTPTPPQTTAQAEAPQESGAFQTPERPAPRPQVYKVDWVPYYRDHETEDWVETTAHKVKKDAEVFLEENEAGGGAGYIMRIQDGVHKFAKWIGVPKVYTDDFDHFESLTGVRPKQPKGIKKADITPRVLGTMPPECGQQEPQPEQEPPVDTHTHEPPALEEVTGSICDTCARGNNPHDVLCVQCSCSDDPIGYVKKHTDVSNQITTTPTTEDTKRWDSEGNEVYPNGKAASDAVLGYRYEDDPSAQAQVAAHGQVHVGGEVVVKEEGYLDETPQVLTAADFDPAVLTAIGEWMGIKKQIEALKKEEESLRADLFAEFFPKPVEGTNTAALPDGWELKGKYPINRTLDDAALPAVIAKLQIAEEHLVDRKPKLKTKAYKALRNDQKLIFDACLVANPGKPNIEVIPPKPPA